MLQKNVRGVVQRERLMLKITKKKKSFISVVMNVRKNIIIALVKQRLQQDQKYQYITIEKELVLIDPQNLFAHT